MIRYRSYIAGTADTPTVGPAPMGGARVIVRSTGVNSEIHVSEAGNVQDASSLQGIVAAGATAEFWAPAGFIVRLVPAPGGRCNAWMIV